MELPTTSMTTATRRPATAAPYLNADPAAHSRNAPRKQLLLAATLLVACVVAAFLAGQHSMRTDVPHTGAATKFATHMHAPQRSQRGKALAAFNIEEQTGVLPPVGFFDPLGLSQGKDEARLKFYREAELKHGRVAMLAATGFLVAEQFHPLFGGNVDSASINAFQQTPLEVFWGPVVAALAAVESRSVVSMKWPNEAMWTLKEDHVVGDFGFDPLGLKPSDPAEFAEKQTKELQNGRLAMLGIAGMVAQELVDGQKIGAGGAASAAVPDAAHIMAAARDLADALNQ